MMGIKYTPAIDMWSLGCILYELYVGYPIFAGEDEKEQMVRYLATGMEALKEEQRVCVELFYIRDMSYQQIAEQTGYSLNEVKSYIQNGKRNLKNYITEKSNGKA